MLVLERKRDESIVITPATSERIVVTLLEIRGDKVRLGVQAPVETSVNRQEVQERIDRDGSHKRPKAQDGREPRRYDPDGGPR